jgi:hypothetical protein
MNNREKIIQYAKIMQASAGKILDMLEGSNEPFEGVAMPPGIPTEPVVAASVEVAAKYEPDWNDWPDAVPGFLISNPTPAGILKRARAVLNMCDLTNLEGRHFLDFGCGDASIVKEAMERRAASSTGFDIVEDWKEEDGILLTTNYKLLKQGHYDTILLYDVLDHSRNPVQVLQQIRELVSDRGEVKVRCHPFTSKHANHVYRTFNKAYSHFFLSSEALKDHDPLPVYRMTGVVPTEQYKKWFNENGFEVRKETIDRQSPDPVCLKNIPRGEIKAIINHEDYQKILEIQFVDYTLTPR